jgi:hypothetical protein
MPGIGTMLALRREVEAIGRDAALAPKKGDR